MRALRNGCYLKVHLGQQKPVNLITFFTYLLMYDDLYLLSILSTLRMVQTWLKMTILIQKHQKLINMPTTSSILFFNRFFFFYLIVQFLSPPPFPLYFSGPDAQGKRTRERTPQVTLCTPKLQLSDIKGLAFTCWNYPRTKAPFTTQRRASKKGEGVHDCFL